MVKAVGRHGVAAERGSSRGIHGVDGVVSQMDCAGHSERVAHGFHAVSIGLLESRLSGRTKDLGSAVDASPPPRPHSLTEALNEGTVFLKADVARSALSTEEREERTHKQALGNLSKA